MKKTNSILRLFIFLALIASADFAYSQLNNVRESALKIFYDCSVCDEEFLKKELTYVNYVRDSKEAQVHILVATETTGNGGDKYSFFFIGQMGFKGQNDTLTVFTNADATNDEIRQKQLQTMKMGLMRYVAKTPIASDIKITFDADEKGDDIVKDKWNSWVFDLNLNGYFRGEKSKKSTSIYSSLNISRVTPNLKVELDFNANYYKEAYSINDTIVTSIENSRNFEHLLVKSLNDHWSVGYVTELGSSIYSNYDFHAFLSPAIEYNIFQYSESSRKQIRFLYHVGPTYNDYIDTTLYDKTKELLFSHRLTIATEFKEKWGSISLSLQGMNYFNNFDFNRLELYSSISLRLVKGLSLRMNGRVALIHDQINLAKGEATSEDILLSRKQLASQYTYWGSIGLTYTFGSIYNNVVNPRFGN